MDSEKSADNKRVTGHWQNFVDYLFFWTAINCSVITKNTWLCQVASREDSFHSHGQPATSFGSSQAVLSSFCFPENKKKCEKKPKPKPFPSPPNNNSTNRKVVIIVMPFLCKTKRKHAMEICLLELGTSLLQVQSQTLHNATQEAAHWVSLTITVTVSRMGWVCALSI